MKRWVFDLDGTLVDTREAVRQAYLAVGVVMPDDAWGKPAQEWLTPEQMYTSHREKALVYPEMLKLHARRLPLLDELTFHVPNLPHSVISVITGASRQAVHALHDTGILPGSVVVHAVGCTRHGKADWLARNGYGTYIDDDLAVRELITDLTSWRVLSPEVALAEFRQRSDR